jgi:hypothetical protein
MVFKRLLIFTPILLTAILPVSAQEKSSLYIDTLNEVDKILGEHHFFKNTTFENSDVIFLMITKNAIEFFLLIKVNISMSLMRLIYLARKEFTEIEMIKKDLLLYR